MGDVIDITPRLILAQQLRATLKEMQFNALHVARKHVENLEQEVTRQQIILWDQKATPAAVEEATYALPLLHELLDKRRKYLGDLQNEFFSERAPSPGG